MAAHKQKNECVIRIHVPLDFNRRHADVCVLPHLGFPFAAGDLAAHLIRHSSRCNLNQPPSWILRNAFLRPLPERRNHGLLHRIFGRWEVAKASHHGSKHLRRKFAQQLLGALVPWPNHHRFLYSISGGGPLIIGRTSMGMFNGAPPGPGAAEAFAAMA